MNYMTVNVGNAEIHVIKNLIKEWEVKRKQMILQVLGTHTKSSEGSTRLAAFPLSPPARCDLCEPFLSLCRSALSYTLTRQMDGNTGKCCCEWRNLITHIFSSPKFFQRHYGCGVNQPLKEMSSRNLPGDGVKMAEEDSLTGGDLITIQ
jgi:hypothetical protein